ncbi:MAG: transglycosylase SLT domain-containing protein, partial [Syntrophales bacterium]
YALDPGLRESLGLGPPLDDSGPASGVQEMDLPEEMEKNAEPDGRQSWLDRFLFPVAWAKGGNPAMHAEIKQWIPPARDPNPYIGKVRNLLEEATNKILVANPLAGDYHSFFHILVSATAWQESCWRQFVVRAGKIRYLISYNGSSVGLMQINERVWRGIYRVESLRWNVSYNVKAGCEILNLYLRNFALKEIKPANPSDLETIAQVTYAMYNGGPDQLKQYLKRSNANRLYRSDRLFREKYTAAKGGNFDELARCLSGK